MYQGSIFDLPEQDEYLILISGLRIFASHGVSREEKTLGQQFEIDLTMKVIHADKLMNDKIESVLSYDIVVKRIEEVFTSKSLNLIENLASTILDELAEFKKIKTARIQIKKITPPISSALQSVGIMMERKYHLDH